MRPLEKFWRNSQLAVIHGTGSPDNTRSRAVMERLCLKRDKARDFTASYDSIGEWCGLVWVARR